MSNSILCCNGILMCTLATNSLGFQRPSISESVISFTELDATLVDLFVLLSVPIKINAGRFGEGRWVSLPNMKTTDDMVGWSIACSYTHKSPIWMHFETSLAGYASSSNGSTIFMELYSLHRSQTWDKILIILGSTI